LDFLSLDEEQGKAQEQESVPDPVQIQTEIQAVQQVQADQQVKAVLAITKPKVDNDVDNGELFQEVGKSKKKNKRRTSQPVIDTKEVEKNDTEESLKESKAKSPKREMKEKETPAQVQAKKNEKPANLEMKENEPKQNRGKLKITKRKEKMKSPAFLKEMFLI